MQLNNYSTGKYTPGVPLLVQLFWYFIGAPLVSSYWIPISIFKVQVLRWFGSQIGDGVVIKPGLKVKFPWRLVIGNYAWLGEDAWLDNLAEIRIGDHVCISQGAYLCTGNHDWTDPNFALQLGAIELEAGSWIGACAVVGPGVTVGQGAVLGLGSVTGRSLRPMTIYTGNPAQPIKPRQIRSSPLASSHPLQD